MLLPKLIVRSVHQETANTKSFVFEKDAALSYLPGQFITLVHKTPLHEIRRQYSFSSHPVLDAYARITVKRIANGEVSRWLFDEVKAGDVLPTTGVSGFFTLPVSLPPVNTALFLAAGSGITPVLSLIKEVLHAHTHVHVVLIYSNSTKASTIFLEELTALQMRFASRFTIEFLYSDAKNLLRARLGKSILEELLRVYVQAPARSVAFVCGPLDYRQMAIVTLLAYGLPAEQIHKEIFHTPEARQKPEPPDTNVHTVHIRYQQQAFTVTTQYPVSILHAAKEQGLLLPYSCEAGRCGTCAATCVDGKIWMSRNEVLTDADVAKGRVLTCTGYAVEGDAVIELP